VVLRG